MCEPNSRPLPEKVNVPAGDYTASKVGIRVFDDGVEMKDAFLHAVFRE